MVEAAHLAVGRSRGQDLEGRLGLDIQYQKELSMTTKPQLDVQAKNEHRDTATPSLQNSLALFVRADLPPLAVPLI
jgi:hypothetical protein